MKKIKLTLIAILLVATSATNYVLSGNKDRAGQAGASQLLINPWARSASWGGVNTACGRGLEASFTNIAGTAFTKQTEILFTHTTYLKGTGLNLAAIGLTQKVGETGVLGLSLQSLSFGDIMITTTELPDGGIGYFSPTFTTVNLSYAKAFSATIFGGLNVKVFNESIADISGTGIAMDAGIQYVTGELENIKFGIALKNVGPPVKYSGDGLDYKVILEGRSDLMNVSMRSAAFELPTLLNIGAAYDFIINDNHRITLAGNFTSNAFKKDQYIAGIEYSFMKNFQVRGGYVYEEGLYDNLIRTTIFSGLNGGLTLALPINKEKGSTIEIDYAYRHTFEFDGVHAIGIRINLQ